MAERLTTLDESGFERGSIFRQHHMLPIGRRPGPGRRGEGYCPTLIHSTVSPTARLTPAGEKVRESVIWMTILRPPEESGGHRRGQWEWGRKAIGMSLRSNPPEESHSPVAWAVRSISCRACEKS